MKFMIRYQVKPDSVDQNVRLLQGAYDELQRVQPDGLNMESYQLDDEVTFVDIVSGDAVRGVLTKLPAFQHFRATLDARCEEPPTMSTLTTIGAYTVELNNS